MKIRAVRLAVALAGASALGLPAHALVIDGLTFAAASGSVALISLTGSGTLADPYVLTEKVSSPDVIISISGLDTWGHGNLSGSGHSAGFVLRKVITNDTGSNWTFYDNELQQTLGIPSTDGDGLSFAQGSSSVRPFTGDLLPVVTEIDLPRDYVNFSGGTVLPGQVLTLTYTITDNSPNSIFYLRQRPNITHEGNPVPEEGATLALLGLALLGIGGLRRRLG